MHNISPRHGGHLALLALVGASALAAPPGGEVTRVRSQVFDVEYRANEAAMPLESVRLWYTLDKGTTWQLYGFDQDCQSPMRFNSPQQGLYGFYFVISNAAGSSGLEPQTGTPAQRWVYVDYTPPLVQLHRPGVDPRSAGGNVVAIRWSAIDAHLPPRPVSLAYKIGSGGDWHSIVGRVANTGRYDWELPGDLQGRIVVRITVVDQGGNSVEAASTLDVAPSPVDQPTADESLAEQAEATLVAREAAIDPQTRERSRKLYQTAVWHKNRGETRLAMARLRDALRLDPSLSPALVDLASLLYGEGEYGASLQAYQLALKQAPDLRSGLEGVARVSIAQRKFRRAAEHLRLILKQNPNDAEAWLHLGDVAIYQGDELAARGHYNKSATVDPTATETVTQARMRLDDLSWLRERYQQAATQP